MALDFGIVMMTKTMKIATTMIIVRLARMMELIMMALVKLMVMKTHFLPSQRASDGASPRAMLRVAGTAAPGAPLSPTLDAPM